MKYNKIIIYCFTAVLVLFTVMMLATSFDEGFDDLFVVEVSSAGKSEEIKCFEDKNEKLYVFLPSYAQLSDAVIRVDDESRISINSVELSDGMNCGAFELDTEYELSYTYFGKLRKSNISFVKSNNIATMYIDTQSRSMEYIHSKKGNEEPGNMRLYTSGGELNYSGDMESINGRGNSTWDYHDKKPYGFNLDSEADLLQMGSANRWVLLANANEPSNLRNKVLYDFADEIGLEYSPDSQWVDLYLNGEYSGLYLLSERNEVHPQRVDIEPDGSFLVSMENVTRLSSENHPQIRTDNNQAIRIHYPKSVTDEYLQQLDSVFQSVENAIMAEDGVDVVSGKHYTQLIDLDTWARKYVLEEVVANWDACSVSQYFYFDSSDESGKIYASPVWDYDNTMGMKTHWAQQPANALYGNRFHVRDGYDAVFFHYLYQKDEFYDKVVEIYEKDVLPKIRTMLDEKLLRYAEQIEQAYKLNQIRWNTEQGDVFDKAKDINTFMKDRIEFLNSIWLDNTAYHTVRVQEIVYVDYIVYEGKSAPTLPQLEDTPTKTFVGWYYKDSEKPYDSSKPVESDVEIYAKWRAKPKESVKDILKVIPAVVFVMLILCLLIIEAKRNSKR